MSERKKGSSLLQLPADYTVIDLETTGLDPQYDHIIEVAAVKVRDGEEVSHYNSLIQPPVQDDDGQAYYVDDFITQLTGITNDMLASAPTFEKIKNDLWQFLDGELLVGHNVNFDINFLYDNFAQYGLTFQNDFVDTMRLSRRALPDLPHHRLKDLCAYFHIDGEFHRAAGDAALTDNVLHHLAKYIKANHVPLTRHRPSVDLRQLQADGAGNPDHPLYGQHCVFTGKLSRFERKQAAQMVVNVGGFCDNNVVKTTNFLVVGSFDYVSNVKGNKSTKIKKAEKLILAGQDLHIISENTFYDMMDAE